jgi:hypothetical protein
MLILPPDLEPDPRRRDLSPAEWRTLCMLCDADARQLDDSATETALWSLRERGLALCHRRLSVGRLGGGTETWDASPAGRTYHLRRLQRELTNRS